MSTKRILSIRRIKRILSIPQILLIMAIMAVSCGQQKSGETKSQNVAVENAAQVPNVTAERQQQQETPAVSPLESQALHEALIKAIRTDDHTAFDRLLSQVADIDMMIPFEEPDYDEKEFSLLGFACKFKRCAMAEKIINRNADLSLGQCDGYICNDALYVAVESKDLCIVQLLLKKDANPNQSQTESGLTVLSVCCRDGGNYDIAKLLIENGAEVNGLGDMGADYIVYPLLEAVQSNNIALVQLLIENNCTVDIVDNEGRTPFSIAAEINNPQMMELLQKHVNPNDE